MKCARIGVWLLGIMLSGHGMTIQAAESEPPASPVNKLQAVVQSNHFGKDWSFALGLKTWFNEWDLPVAYFAEGPGGRESNLILRIQSEDEWSFIPAFTVRYRNFFLGGSYLPSTEYSFEPVIQQGRIMYRGGVGVNMGEHKFDYTADRQELDLNLGYLVTPHLALSVGYKYIERDIQADSYFRSYLTNTVSYLNWEDNVASHVPIIGGAASLPLTDRFNFTGTLAFGLLFGDADGGEYYLGEVGLSYTLPMEQYVSALTVSAGYRYQLLDIDSDKAQTSNSDSTSGFTVGLQASF